MRIIMNCSRDTTAPLSAWRKLYCKRWATFCQTLQLQLGAPSKTIWVPNENQPWSGVVHRAPCCFTFHGVDSPLYSNLKGYFYPLHKILKGVFFLFSCCWGETTGTERERERERERASKKEKETQTEEWVHTDTETSSRRGTSSHKRGMSSQRQRNECIQMHVFTQ